MAGLWRGMTQRGCRECGMAGVKWRVMWQWFGEWKMQGGNVTLAWCRHLTWRGLNWLGCPRKLADAHQDAEELEEVIGFVFFASSV